MVPLVVLSAPDVPGIYELSFLANGQPTESILFVGEELVLKAHVTDSFGTSADQGSVTFQFCSRAGGKSLSNMDPAPSFDCDVAGTGTWKTLVTMKVNPGTCGPDSVGYACVDFGLIRSPRTVGFRFRYVSQGSGIASGMSASKDAEWVVP
jgi:hypothetical protein